MLFIFQTLPYSFCACVRNTPKNYDVCHWKDETGVFQFIFRCPPPPPPPRPKMPFGQRHVALNIYNICKGHLGSRGEVYKNKMKDTSFIFPITNVTSLGVFRTTYQIGIPHFGRICESWLFEITTFHMQNIFISKVKLILNTKLLK